MWKWISLFLSVFPAVAGAQSMQSHCLAMAQGPERIMQAGFRDPLPQDTVRITYVSHATFVIQGGGASAATDYTGFLGMADFTPDVVTMNNAHETHWTSIPDPNIPYVLEGWAKNDQPAQHWVQVADMVVRNVPSDVRSTYGNVRENGNSIFVFEAGGLCIAHVGHLHQELSESQYTQLGRMDVIIVPVDGGFTMSHDAMIRVIERSAARVVIPMHWFTINKRDEFLARMQGEGFALDIRDSNEMTLSLLDLPREPTVVMLKPDFLRDQ